VNPTRSQNNTEQIRRSVAGDPGGAESAGATAVMRGEVAVLTGVPHCPQNFALTGKDAAHEEQAACCGDPHSRQNFAPTGTSVPQAGHAMVGP